MTIRYETVALRVGSGSAELELQLHRAMTQKRNAPAVLLLHGGNTDSDTFLYPQGGLAGHLARDFDVWLLDWRGSPRIVDALLEREPLGGSAREERRHFTLDTVAELDLPRACAAVREAIGPHRSFSVLAHCLSGPALCLALVRGALDPYKLDNLVLMTLGLFCEVPWNGWLKAENFFLERVICATGSTAECRGLSPKLPHEWPTQMAEAYETWPRAWLPDDAEFLKRLTFMIGQPFAREHLHPELLEVGVERFFGHLHLGLYMHAGQIVRRGYVAPFDAPDVIDRTRVSALSPSVKAAALRDLVSERIAAARLTLVTATRNQVWHRDSMDLMYDWLRNNGSARCQKEVFPGYNLQELLWGRNVASEVYPRLARALARSS
jgi:pimeloyl-ACP methyl ester carboxylesterase